MPSRGAANGRKTLSDSEVLAYSRNRHAERFLTHTTRRLIDQEQLVQDRHQREVLRWRDFRRESTKTSGIWCPSGDGEFTEDWFSPVEDLPQAKRDREHGNGSAGGSPINSPRQRGNSSTGHSSNELARSLALHSEAVSKLHKPWAYAYSVTSYNHAYNEAVQLAQGQKKSLYFRRESSISSRGSSPDEKELFRSRSSIGDVGQDLDSGARSRPLTGRSTPGLSRTSRSRGSLSLTASIDKARPRTSVGLVRVTKNHETGSREKKNNGHPHNYQAICGETVANNETRTQSVSTQNSDKSLVFQTYGDDDSNGLTRRTKNTSNSTPDPRCQTHSVSLVPDPNKQSTGENKEYAVVKDRCLDLPLLEGNSETNMNNGSQLISETEILDLSLLEGNSETNVNDGSQLISGTETDKHLKEQLLFERVDQNDVSNHIKCDETRPKDECTSPILASTPRKQPKEKKVHIKLTEEEQVDRPVSRINSNARATRDQSCLKDKRIKPLEDSLRRDLDSPHLTAAAKETARTAWSSSPTSRRQKTRRENRDYKRPKSICCDNTKRRSSDTGVLRQHHDGMSDFPKANRVSSGVLSRRYSAIDVRRRGSFMKIVDRLDALQKFSHHRKIPLDSSKEDWFENEVSGSPNEANAKATSGKEGIVTDTVVHQSNHTKTGATDAGKTRQNSEENQSQSSPQWEKGKPNDVTTPHIHKPRSNAKENQPALRKNSPSEKTEENTEPSSELANPEEINDDADISPTNRTSSDRSPPSDVDYTTFKGFKIHNYIRPQERYRADPLSNLRRDRSLMRASMENPACLRGQQEEVKPAMIFPKASRQKVLQELVHRHNQPARAPDSGVVPPELRAKIDDFFKTIEPYCPKPDLLLD